MCAVRAFFPLLLALAVSGCGRAPRPALTAPAAAAASMPSRPAPAAARAAALRGRRAGLEAVRGRHDRDGQGADFTAYFEGEALRYLEERLHAGALTLSNDYYFEDGALRHYRGEAPPAAGPGGAGARVPVEVEFQGARVLQAVRLEHYGEVPLAASAVLAIRRAAAELAAAATRERQARAAGAAPARPIA